MRQFGMKGTLEDPGLVATKRKVEARAQNRGRPKNATACRKEKS